MNLWWVGSSGCKPILVFSLAQPEQYIPCHVCSVLMNLCSISNISICNVTYDRYDYTGMLFPDNTDNDTDISVWINIKPILDSYQIYISVWLYITPIPIIGLDRNQYIESKLTILTNFSLSDITVTYPVFKSN